MARFDSAIALAKRLITKNGQAVTLRSFSAGAAPDPAKPWKPGTNTPVDQPAVAVFLDYEQKYVDGDTVRMGDQRVFMPASGLTSAPEVEGLVLRRVPPGVPRTLGGAHTATRDAAIPLCAASTARGC